jgi:hypothetical protein
MTDYDGLPRNQTKTRTMRLGYQAGFELCEDASAFAQMLLPSPKRYGGRAGGYPFAQKSSASAKRLWRDKTEDRQVAARSRKGMIGDVLFTGRHMLTLCVEAFIRILF